MPSVIPPLYNAIMFGESLDLADVLKKLRRADEALTEFVAPVWPGVSMVAAWMEKGPQLFQLASAPESAGYYLLGSDGEFASIVRAADAHEAQRYRNYFDRSTVILLGDELAFPASFAERLQGITNPRPILFAEGKPLDEVVARFDGLNLLYERTPSAEKSSSPLAGLFSDASIFSPGELLGVPGQDAAEGEAEKVMETIREHPYLATEFRLKAIVESAGATLDDWSHLEGGGGIELRWLREDEAHEVDY